MEVNWQGKDFAKNTIGLTGGEGRSVLFSEPRRVNASWCSTQSRRRRRRRFRLWVAGNPMLAHWPICPVGNAGKPTNSSAADLVHTNMQVSLAKNASEAKDFVSPKNCHSLSMGEHLSSRSTEHLMKLKMGRHSVSQLLSASCHCHSLPGWVLIWFYDHFVIIVITLWSCHCFHILHLSPSACHFLRNAGNAVPFVGRPCFPATFFSATIFFHNFFSTTIFFLLHCFAQTNPSDFLLGGKSDIWQDQQPELIQRRSYLLSLRPDWVRWRIHTL